MTTYRIHPNVVVNEMGGEWVVVPLVDSVAQMDKVFVLNETGGFILRVLQEPQSAQALLESLMHEFEASREVLQADLTHFLYDALNHQIIVEE